MKRVLLAIGILAALGARPVWAQSADECVPSALNIPEPLKTNPRTVT